MQVLELLIWVVSDPSEAMHALDSISMDSCLIIDGDSLQVPQFNLTFKTCLDHCRSEFVSITTNLSVVVCCRCSPTQKAQVTTLIKESTKKRVAAIGDGGNDVSMIQAAHVGIGIVGKEGQQASLAADVSVLQFRYLTRLLLWHGRNSCTICCVFIDSPYR